METLAIVGITISVALLITALVILIWSSGP